MSELVLRSSANAASRAYPVETLLEIVAEQRIFGIGVGVRPERSQTPYKARDPIGCLQCLITMAFGLEWRLDHVSALRFLPIHASRRSGNQLFALFVLIENQDEVACRTTILCAKLVNPLYRFQKYSGV